MSSPFEITFAPAQMAVDLLAKIANEPDNPHYTAAWVALEAWRSSLATPEQIAMVETNDELEIDDAGACVSEGEDGFFIQTWTWVECQMTEDCEACGCTPDDGLLEKLDGKWLCLDCYEKATTGPVCHNCGNTTWSRDPETGEMHCAACSQSQ